MFRWAEMMMSTAFLIGVTMNMFFLSLIAQYLLDHSLNIHESAYSGAWYNMPAKIQKAIVLIFIRSRLPCQLTAGKLFIMSLESFCSIMQTSMSYFTVLVSFR
ncbi:putative odorant receptor 85e [Harpegnathos saltator]|uniref:putative odorant receptor 85e n=1 Tax=Harpegnathos saltator TaxID=610380 RepID=UPI000948F0E3|nr:putative odorant receptor 85e [Harpegnathos saltator]